MNNLICVGIVLAMSLMLSACVQNQPYTGQYHNNDSGYTSDYHNDVTSGYNSDYNGYKRTRVQPPMKRPVNSGYSSS